MKRILLAVSSLLMLAHSSAQSHVNWTFKAVKATKTEYQIIMQGKIDPGYTVTSIEQPSNSIGFPLKAHFDSSWTIIPIWDRVSEISTNVGIEQMPDIGLSRWYYEDHFDLIIPYKLMAKPGSPPIVHLLGHITYEVYDEKSNPDISRVNFDITIDNTRKL